MSCSPGAVAKRESEGVYNQVQPTFRDVRQDQREWGRRPPALQLPETQTGRNSGRVSCL